MLRRIVYVNGAYVPYEQAAVHVEDRGYQFGDGIYEVVPVLNGRFANMAHHMARLDRSLREMRMPWPMAVTALRHVMGEVVRRSALRDGMVYMQVTRGVQPRNHAFPAEPAPSLVIIPKRIDYAAKEALAAQGVAVISQPDLRWARRDIKTINLLPNCFANTAAAEAGVAEAILVGADGLVTEASHSNFWIVDKAGQLRTRALGPEILPGCTRAAVLDLLATHGIALSEQPFTLAEVLAAREAFLTSATAFVLPVVRVDGQPIGGGRPGPVATQLRALYWQMLRA